MIGFFNYDLKLHKHYCNLGKFRVTQIRKEIEFVFIFEINADECGTRILECYKNVSYVKCITCNIALIYFFICMTFVCFIV